MIIPYFLTYLYYEPYLKSNKILIWIYETCNFLFIYKMIKQFSIHWRNDVNILVWCLNTNTNIVEMGNSKIINDGDKDKEIAN